MHIMCVYVTCQQCMCGGQDNILESFLSSHLYVDSKDRTQAVTSELKCFTYWSVLLALAFEFWIL